jgi:hypothetical protein
MDTPIRETLSGLLADLDAQSQEQSHDDLTAERVRKVLEAAREAETAWASVESGFVQLPDPEAVASDWTNGTAEGEAMESDAADEIGVEALRRELHTVRSAYADAKQRMIRFEQLHEDLQNQIQSLLNEREVLRARVTELEASQAVPTQAKPDRAENAATPSGFEAFTPTGQKRRLGEILVEAGVINETQLQELLEEQARKPQSRLGVLVVERGITSEEIVARVLAAQLRLPYLELDNYHVIEAAALQVPEDIARRHECIAIDGDLHSMTLAMANPLDLLAIENIEITCKRRVAAVVAKPSSVMAAIHRTYSAL